jgi:hypothetical protein
LHVRDGNKVKKAENKNGEVKELHAKVGHLLIDNKIKQLPIISMAHIYSDTFFNYIDQSAELLSSLVFEGFGSCGDLACLGGFDAVFERDAGDDFGEVIKAA